MIEQVTVPTWVSVKYETRTKLRELFMIPHSSHAEVITDAMGHSTVMSDGTTNTDLQSLTVERLRDYLGSAAINETVHDLFKKVVEKIEKPVEIVPQGSINEVKSEPIKEVNNNKCPDCEYTHASKQGLRMHIMKKHLKK